VTRPGTGTRGGAATDGARTAALGTPAVRVPKDAREGAPRDVALQPVSRVLWIERDHLRANAWNPNRVAPPELALLALSLLEDGWTSPIVVTPDHEIVDGYHRWLVAAHPRVAALTGGLVPVVTIEASAAGRRLATVRHNRARGAHHVLAMAELVDDLVHEEQMDPDEVGTRLGMEPEEVQRLLERGSIVARGGSDRLSQAWAPDASEREREAQR